jgi:hypothetical protein
LVADQIRHYRRAGGAGFEVAKRSDKLGGLVAALPLVTVRNAVMASHYRPIICGVMMTAY